MVSALEFLLVCFCLSRFAWRLRGLVRYVVAVGGEVIVVSSYFAACVSSMLSLSWSVHGADGKQYRVWDE